MDIQHIFESNRSQNSNLMKNKPSAFQIMLKMSNMDHRRLPKKEEKKYGAHKIVKVVLD